MTHSKGYLLWMWATIAFTGVLTIVYRLMPTGHPVFLGFSLPRLAILTATWGATLILVWFKIKGREHSIQKLVGEKAWLWFWGWALWASLTLYLVPPERFKWAYRATWEGLLPFWGWCTGVSLGNWLYGLYKQGFLTARRFPSVRWLKPFKALLLGELFLAFLVVIQGWGWSRSFELHWQGIGIPLLSVQVWIVVSVLAVWLTLTRVAKKHKQKILKFMAGREEMWFILLLLAVTFGVWLATTPVDSYFLTRPYPPNNEFYPASDAAVLDLSSWQGVFGYGLMAARKYDNRGVPAGSHLGYVGFLAMLHWLFRDVSLFYMAYLAILASASVLLYRLGSYLHSRWAGIFLAGLNLGLEVNKMRGADWAITAHSREMMTEPVVRLLLMTAMLLVVLWLHNPRSRRWWLIAIGAILALASLVRAEAYALLVLPLFFIFFGLQQKHWTQKVISLTIYGGLFVIGVFGVYLPWMGRAAILSNRLHKPLQGSPWFFYWVIKGKMDSRWRQLEKPVSTSAQDISLFTNTNLPLVVNNTVFPEISEEDVFFEKSGALFHWWALNGENLILLLPSTFRFFSLEDVMLRVSPYWGRVKGRRWYDLGRLEISILTLNLLLMLIGLAVLYNDKSTRPVLLSLGGMVALYTLAVSVGKEAGGRFDVPVDWVLLLVYAVGAAELFRIGWQWLVGEQSAWLWERWVPATSTSTALKVGYSAITFSWLMVVLEFVFIGWVIYADLDVPTHWRAATPQQVLHRLNEWQTWKYLPWSKKAVQAALIRNKVNYQWGYVFYPRSLPPGVNCGDLCRHQKVTKPTLYFDGISSLGRFQFYLEGVQVDEPVRDGSEMITFYCSPKSPLLRRYQALALIVRSPNGQLRVWANPEKTHLQCLSP